MKHALITAAFALAALSACSAEQDSTEQPAPAQVAAAPAPAPVATAESPATEPAVSYDTGYSIRTLMNAIVKPNADQLWQAVRYVVTEDGVAEDVKPETDEDWTRLRRSAITLVEAGNALLLPGRVMDHTPPGSDYPDWQYLPEEMQALMATDPEGWRYYVQEMQVTTNALLAIIDKRDILGLIDNGARINNACNGCHADFWYRPNNR